MRILLVATAIVSLVSCSTPSPGRLTPSVAGGESFQASELREPAVFVRVEVESGNFTERERAELPREYEGALLEGLNARAILTKDMRVVSMRERLDSKLGLARAREIGADHVLVVDVRVSRGGTVTCRGRRRPLRSVATRWSQAIEVIRAVDGATRFAIARPGVEVADLDPDCDEPQDAEQRSLGDTTNRAVERLLQRVFGS